jgi:hypothetical protein
VEIVEAAEVDLQRYRQRSIDLQTSLGVDAPCSPHTRRLLRYRRRLVDLGTN